MFDVLLGSTVNQTNKNYEAPVLKVQAQSRIKFSEGFLKSINHKPTNHIYIGTDPNYNVTIIASLPIVKDDNGKVTTPGKAINNGCFTSQNIAKMLGDNTQWEATEVHRAFDHYTTYILNSVEELQADHETEEENLSF